MTWWLQILYAATWFFAGAVVTHEVTVWRQSRRRGGYVAPVARESHLEWTGEFWKPPRVSR